jgi:hypothetical protein
MSQDLNTVYHVGFLDILNLSNRPRVDFSLEGNGLSVSQHPQEWTKIAKLGGKDLYKLFKEDANFFMAYEEGHEKALEWCVENEYLIRKKKFRAYSSDEEGEEYYRELDTKKQAEKESDDIRSVKGYAFSKKGKEYWIQHFSSDPRNSMAEDFAVIFYAEALGYDGIWWNEELNTSIYSAPRGVIFQAKLELWKISEI